MFSVRRERCFGECSCEFCPKKGVTLLEMIVVAGIIAFLVAFVGLVATRVIGKGKIARFEGDINAIEKGVMMFWADTNEFPAKNKVGDCIELGNSFQDLFENPGIPTWNGPYIDKKVSKFSYFLVCTYFAVPNWSELSGYAQLITVPNFPPELTEKVEKDLDDGSGNTGRVQWNPANNTLIIGIISVEKAGEQGPTGPPPPPLP